MKQLSLADEVVGSFRRVKETRRERFLREMDGVIPWASQCQLLAVHYPQGTYYASGRKAGQVRTEETITLHSDQLNTPRLATSATQGIVWRWNSDPFGNGRPDPDPDADSDRTPVRLRFPGQTQDIAAPLFQNHHRDFDPTIGRYIQTDPIGLAGGISTYAYVGSNPINLIDPMGLDGYNAAQYALWKEGSTEYQYFDMHPESRGRMATPMQGMKSNKCNAFVWDSLYGGGDPPGRMPDGRIPSANEWASPTANIPGYRVIPLGTALRPGDVVATGGHVGLYSPLPSGQHGTVSAAAGANGKVVHNDWGFRPGQAPTVRRCECDMQ